LKKLSEKILHQGKWLALKEAIYESKKGERFTWESIERKGTGAIVIIVARLIPSNKIIFIRQFRPVINNYIIGFPAGISHGEPVEETALRELREETGYAGKIISVSPPLAVNSAIIPDHLYVVEMNVDEEESFNNDPKQDLEPSEEIEVFCIRKKEIRKFIDDHHALGDEIGSGVWHMFGTSITSF
jgi:ADP-ribose pyrophosphatase